MKLLTSILIFTLWPAASLPQPEETLTFGEYRFEVSYRPSGGRGYRITKDGQELYTASPGQFNLISVSKGKQIYPAEPTVTDITGDKSPDLIVEEFPLGLRCCWSYSIFSLGSKFSLIGRLEGFTSPMTFEDVNNDSVYEVTGYDFTYNDWYASPRVILSYSKGQFRFSPELMRRPAPDNGTLTAKAQEFLKSERPALLPVPPDVHRYMLDLIYSGNAQSAWDFLDLSWPKDNPGKDEFRQSFLEKVKQSPYWENLQAMNGADTL
jgi:hypothetical protein